MPSKSPYAPTFKSAVSRGTPCWTAVISIATKTGKSPAAIFKSLFGAGLVARQKFNGQWIYWPTFAKKSSTTYTKVSQYNLWQAFVDWCICSGFCTPRQFTSHKGSQPTFVNFFRKFWNLQFPGSSTTGFGSWSVPGQSFGFGGFGGGFGKGFGTTTRKAKPRRKTRRTTTKARRRTTKARRRTTKARRRTTGTRGRWSTVKARRTTTKRARRTTPRRRTTTTRSWGRTRSYGYTPSYKISRYRKSSTTRRYRRAA